MTTAIKLYFQKFTVRGSGPFPIDMLRYDYCWPATEQDSGLIQCDRMTERMTRGVRISRVVEQGKVPTDARWQSFGWTVFDVTQNRYPL